MDLSPIPHQVMNYSFEFEFESEFDYHSKHEWMTRYWRYSFVLAFVYVFAALWGQKLMEKRAKYELRSALFLWNFMLALFSIVGATRTAPELINGLTNFGFRYTLCNNSVINHPKPAALWSWLFIISKCPELGDTIFIVLRKQRLIFLHWFHHATVLVYCFYSYYSMSATGRWFIVINYSIHACMYSYFALKALSFKIPRFVSMTITIVQLLQMVLGCFINYSAYQYKMADPEECAVPVTNIKASFLMYAIYFLLFSAFFGNSYLSIKTRPTKQSQEKESLKND